MSDLLDRASELEQQQREVAIKQALKRPAVEQDIDEDGNHYCDDCGIRIPPERIAAVPSAVCCIDCQSIREHERKKLCSKI